ncbi:hypothetical protein ABKV19_014346 [Rosa sericea]
MQKTSKTAKVNVLCCFYEALLCWACEEKVHATTSSPTRISQTYMDGIKAVLDRKDHCLIVNISDLYFFGDLGNRILRNLSDSSV